MSGRGWLNVAVAMILVVGVACGTRAAAQPSAATPSAGTSAPVPPATPDAGSSPPAPATPSSSAVAEKADAKQKLEAAIVAKENAAGTKDESAATETAQEKYDAYKALDAQLEALQRWSAAFVLRGTGLVAATGQNVVGGEAVYLLRPPAVPSRVFDVSLSLLSTQGGDWYEDRRAVVRPMIGVSWGTVGHVGVAGGLAIRAEGAGGPWAFAVARATAGFRTTERRPGTDSFLGILEVYLEPWFPLDAGSPTVLFGLSLGAGGIIR